MRSGGGSRGRTADPRLSLPADRPPDRRGKDGTGGQCEEGPVSGALGHGQCRRQDHRCRKCQCAGDRARRFLRLQHARLRYAGAADPRRHRRSRDLRCHAFGAAAGRAGDLFGRPARICAGAGARCGGGRRRRRFHRDSRRPRQSAVRRSQHDAVAGDGGTAAHAGGVRPPGKTRGRSPGAMNPLYLVSFMAFTAALSSRAVDPVIPLVAGDLWVTPATAAILSTAFALPYGFIQPVLGPVADAMGETRVMTFCMAVFTLASFLSAMVESFSLLLALRVITGAACGGSFPVALAFIGDQVPVAQRQVAIGRLLAATIGGNLIGATLSGVIADLVHWRGIFIVLGCVGAVALTAGLIGFRGMPNVRRAARLSDVKANFRGLLLNPNGQVCFGSVMLEGIFLFGVFPYVAVLLLAAGDGRAF